jgi:hypothetical protein
LRCKQIGLSFDEIDQLSTGQIYDMIIESQNDGYDYPLKATDDMYENF